MAKKKKAVKKKSAPTKACPYCCKPNHPRRKLCEHCGKPTVAVTKPRKKRTAVNVGVGATYSLERKKPNTPEGMIVLRTAAVLLNDCGMDKKAAIKAIHQVDSIACHLADRPVTASMREV